MGALQDPEARSDVLNRLRRAEGQLRGIQRMVEEGEDCMKIGQQFSAVRKALDSTYVRMAMCFLTQEMDSRLSANAPDDDKLSEVLDDFATLLGRLR